MNVDVVIKPELDQDFLPAVLWNRAYRDLVQESGNGSEVVIALLRPDETCSVFRTQILPLAAEDEKLTLRYLERILKFLFWQRGGCSVLIAGCDSLVGKLAAIDRKSVV